VEERNYFQKRRRGGFVLVKEGLIEGGKGGSKKGRA